MSCPRLRDCSTLSARREIRAPKGWLQLRGVSRNNLDGVDIDFPLGVFTTVSGVSGSGKSTLVSQVLVELVSEHLGLARMEEDERLDDEVPAAAPAP